MSFLYTHSISHKGKIARAADDTNVLIQFWVKNTVLDEESEKDVRRSGCNLERTNQCSLSVLI